MANRERELRYKIVGDSSSAEAAFKRTSNAAEKLGPSATVANKALENVSAALTSRLGAASGVADDALKRVGGSAIAAGGAMTTGIVGGVAVAGAALAAFAADGVGQMLDLTGEIRNFQRASGAGAEDSSRFVAVLDDLQISSESGATALFKLGREVSAGAPKLREYGIEVAKNADGTANLAETLLNVSDAYTRAPDQATKTAIAFAAFGKQAQSLLPLLEKGRVGLAEFFEGAESGHQIFSQDELDKARELELSLDDLQDAIRGLQLVGAKALTPFLSSLAEVSTKTVDFAEKVGAAVGGLNQKVGGALGGIASSTAKQLLGPLGDVAEAASFFGDEADDAAGSAKELGDASGPAAEEVAELAAAQTDAAEAAKKQAAALRDVLKASEDLIGSQLSVADATDRLRDGQADSIGKEKALADAIRDHGRSSSEAARAAEELEDARRAELRDIDALAKARRDLAAQQAAQAGQPLDDAGSYRIYRDELIKLKDAIAPGSPLRTHLESLINDLPPPEVKFAVVAETEAAKKKLEELRGIYKTIAAGPTILGAQPRIRVAGDPDGPGPAAPPSISLPRRPAYHEGDEVLHAGGVAGHTHRGAAKLASDEVPAVLQRGEFVVRKSAVRRLGLRLLRRLNRAAESTVAPAAAEPEGMPSPTPRSRTGRVLSEDEAPYTSPSGAAMTEFRDGRATYADGRVFTAAGWVQTQPRGKGLRFNPNLVLDTTQIEDRRQWEQPDPRRGPMGQHIRYLHDGGVVDGGGTTASGPLTDATHVAPATGGDALLAAIGALREAVSAIPAAQIDASTRNEFHGGDLPTQSQLDYAARQQARRLASVVRR